MSRCDPAPISYHCRGHSAFLTSSGDVAVVGRPLDFKNTLRNINIRGVLPILQRLMTTTAKLLFRQDMALQLVPRHENDPYVHVVCSKGGITGMVTASGKAYVFGGNQFGQCGVGGESELQLEPSTPVQGFVAATSTSNVSAAVTASSADGVRPAVSGQPLTGEKVVGLSLGLEHGLAVTDRGWLYAWGRGDRGQLGLGDTDHCKIAIRVLGPQQSFVDLPFVAVAAGISQSTAIDVYGRLWVWGKMASLQHKQARSGGFVMEDQLLPRRLQFADEVEVEGAAASADDAGAVAAGSNVVDPMSVLSSVLPSLNVAVLLDHAQLQPAETHAATAASPAPSNASTPPSSTATTDSTAKHTVVITRGDSVPSPGVLMMTSSSGSSSVPAAGDADDADPTAVPALGTSPNYSSSTSGSSLPLQPGQKRRVVAVTHGQAHTSILTDDGRLWMTGLRGRGIHYDDSEYGVAPLPVGHAGAREAQAANLGLSAAPGAPSHSAAASSSALSTDPHLPEVYMQVEPLEIPAGALAGHRVVKLRSSLHHSFAITDGGLVFRWGWRGIVQQVDELCGIGIYDLNFGYCHTVLVAEQRGPSAGAADGSTATAGASAG